MFRRRIYLDYASLTPIDPQVIREVNKYSSITYTNPSSLYFEGVSAKKALIQGRKIVADFINAHSDEIVFTSGGTEANNLALNGVIQSARANGIEKPHIIISSIEHSSIIETVNILEKQGCEVTRLSVNHSGIVSLDELRKSIKANTVLVSIMTVNNEVGTIQPIREIAKIVRRARLKSDEPAGGDSSPDLSEAKRRENPVAPRGRMNNVYPLFHTDSAQAAIYQDLNVEKLGVDLLTLDGSKAYGPRGIGCLYIRRNTPINPIIYGGGQEFGMRSGTENLPAIMGFAKALQIAKIQVLRFRIQELKDMMISGLKAIYPNIVVNGGGEVSPHVLNVSIPGIDNEFFVLQLDAKGVACSTKSSCLRDEDESYVLKAMGIDSKISVRFSFGKWTKKREIGRALKVIKNLAIH